MQNRQKGIVLPIVLMILIILSILGMALAGRMTFDARAERIYEDQMQAHFLARSGLLIARNYLQQNQASLVANSTSYIYGNLNSTGASQTLSISNTAPASPYNIVVQCKVNQTNNKKIALQSTGKYNNQSEVINSNIDFTASGTPSEASALESAASAIASGAPLTIPTVDGNTFLDARTVSFYDESGKETSFIDSTGSIKNNVDLHSTHTTDCVIYDATVMVNFKQHQSTLSTGTMFFANPDTSLSISNQSELELAADFISFYGNVKIQNNNAKNDTHLYLHTVNSTLTENQLKTGGSSTLKYGLIYFGKNMYTGRNADILVKESNNTTNVHGYYFFPDEIDLPSESYKLIPASGLITSTLLSQLHVPGTFQGTQAGTDSGDNMTYVP